MTLARKNQRIEQRNTSLHLKFVRELLQMRKRIERAPRLILVGVIISLASCQSGGSGGNATSKQDVTDPNISFSKSASSKSAP